jgi:hypothetical protein
MKKEISRLLLLICLSASVFSCKKDYGDNLGPLEDSIADTPVTVANATYFERIPVVTSSIAAGGNVNITLQIPADKGRIKQISRVATGATLANLQSTNPAFWLNYNTTSNSAVPIAGNGSNSITYTSTLNTYAAYRTRLMTVPGYVAGTNLAGNAPTVATTGTPAVPDERNPNFIRYWFLITLEDGRDIITTEVRVRILP